MGKKITGDIDQEITLDQILLIVNGDKRVIGNPTIAKAKITAKIVEQAKDKKIRVATYKAKARSRRVKG